MKETLTERHSNEKLTDNTKISYCEQCEKCMFWGNGSVFSNKYDKSSCDQYPYPASKPSYVINNTGDCAFFARGK